MGAYGAAIIGVNEYVEGAKSKVLTKDELDGFAVETSNDRCQKCGNHCLLTISTFSDGNKYVSGNR